MQQALTDAGLKPGDINEVILVGGQTRMPKVQEIVKSFFARSPQGVNPTKCGDRAAIQAACSRRGEGRPAARRHAAVARHRDAGAASTVLIPRNTTIPTKKSEVFSTAEDNQTTVEIHVLQGERQMRRTTAPSASSSSPDSTGSARHPQVEVGSISTRTASCTWRRRTRPRARSRRSGSRPRPASRQGHRQDGEGRRGARGRG